MSIQLKQPVSSLRNVGSQREKQLHKLGIHTVGELLRHYPRDYIDLSSPCTVAQASFERPCAVLAQVVRKHSATRIRGGMTLYKVDVCDPDGVGLTLVFFNNKYTPQNLTVDASYLFYGTVSGSLLKREMHTPQVYPLRADAPPFAAIYPLTQGISSRILASLMTQALEAAPQMPELLAPAIWEARALPTIAEALHGIHRPGNMQELVLARKRLVFEELFVLAVGIALLGTRQRTESAHALPACSMQPFYDALPFTLTGAQQRAIEELTADLQRTVPANRLVQGDVGSGKTMVAAAGAYFVHCGGGQTALMAPTELLARQHYEGLSRLLEPLGVQVDLLTGSMTAAQKRAAYARLETGATSLCIGTHALLSRGVQFRELSLVVTDEQHRFGVAQRTALGQKGRSPHTLVMSATPIPRTLALMIYGELQLSVIDELPPGRIPIETFKISGAKRARAFGFVQEQLRAGRQAYIVCPLVQTEEDSTMQLHAAADYLQELSEGPFADFRVGLLHGRMRAAEKESVMAAFSTGEVQLLISTTVVEVGVDVPNASVMLIENAERFGLSQLHQLRGRVGRGKHQSYCILVSDSRSPETLERLFMLCKTTDGFQLAEYDLKTRGPGNFLGHQQHGLPDLHLANLVSDMEEVADAQECARALLEQDPLLEQPAHTALREAASALLDAVGGHLN